MQEKGKDETDHPPVVKRHARWLSGVLVLAGAAFVSMPRAQAPAPSTMPPADLVLRGGKVITLDPIGSGRAGDCRPRRPHRCHWVGCGDPAPHRPSHASDPAGRARRGARFHRLAHSRGKHR